MLNEVCFETPSARFTNITRGVLAEKGGSRTLRGPYGPQTGFEDQRHHRAPSFSPLVFSYLAALFLSSAGSCLPFVFTISNPNARAT
jgi:hypothetical protein